MTDSMKSNSGATGAIPTIRPETSALYPSSVYTFQSLDDVEAYYDAPSPNQFLYRRNGHPNERPVEGWLARLEEAEGAALCSSGMAAISQACMANLKPGHHLIATSYLYGGTYAFFEQVLRPWGVEISYTDLNDSQALQTELKPNTKLIYAESVANPLLQVADLPGIGRFARENGLKLLVDNTFATPLLVRPMTYGATLSIHSLTKYLNGHSDVVGGAVCGSHEEVERVRKFAVTFGGTLAPFDAWMTERGLQTLHLRFPAQCQNALEIATFLSESDKVNRVYYPGLPEHKTHVIAKQILQRGYGAMVTFEVHGGKQGANEFIQRLSHISFAPSLGGVLTTVSHPALTSHRAFAEADRRKLGITDGLIRLSVGAEPVHTLINELKEALSSD